MSEYTHKAIDPVRVANLEQYEFDMLYQAVDLMATYSLDDFPPDFLAFTFRTMRKLGSTVKSKTDMFIVAHMLRGNRRLINSLRTYGA